MAAENSWDRIADQVLLAVTCLLALGRMTRGAPFALPHQWTLLIVA